MIHTFWRFFVVSSVLLAVGCGSDGPYSVVPARGTIKYDDGSRIEASRIDLVFISQQPPVDAKTHPRQGVAQVNVDDGTFQVTTYEYGDGLIEGKHKVLAMAAAGQGGRSSHIPRHYNKVETTPLEIDTKDAPFELLVEKP